MGRECGGRTSARGERRPFMHFMSRVLQILIDEVLVEVKRCDHAGKANVTTSRTRRPQQAGIDPTRCGRRLWIHHGLLSCGLVA